MNPTINVTLNFSAIVATGLDCAIGKDGSMPWHLPEDLIQFKTLTLNHPIVMGRKTFASLGRVLPNRPHIVLTRMGQSEFDDAFQSFANPTMQGVFKIGSFEELPALLKGFDFQKSLSEIQSQSLTNQGSNGVFVIGGAEIYKLALEKKYISKIFKTEIQKTFSDADTFFPALPMNEWNLENEAPILHSATGLQYRFQTFSTRQ